MEFKQLLAFLQVLSFLGTVALLVGGCAALGAVWIIGESHITHGASAVSRWVFSGRGLVGKLAACLGVLLGGYLAVLLGTSLVSEEWVLGPGEEKYFCEVDCHLAYSVTGVARTKTLGSREHLITANGVFYIVTIRTRFDEKTISSHRPLEVPLQPAPRVVTIVDDHGLEFLASALGEQALARTSGLGTPMTQPLRPGESYTTQLVFELPPFALNPRLLIASPTQPAWLGLLLIGDENSFLHKKVFLRLAA